jgi:hypothetical protein
MSYTGEQARSVTGEERVYYRASQMQKGQGDQREREEQEGKREQANLK